MRLIRRLRTAEWVRMDRERKRIADDLHDFVGAKMLQIKQDLEQLERLPRADFWRERMHQARTEVDGFHEELRDVVEAMAPKWLEFDSLERQLEHLVAEFPLPDGSIYLEMESKAVLSKEVRYHVHWCLRELITNALKYSRPASMQLFVAEEQAHRLTIRLIYRAEEPAFVGSAFKRLGRGKFSLRQRVKQFHGKIGSYFVEGCRNDVIEIPLEP